MLWSGYPCPLGYLWDRERIVAGYHLYADTLLIEERKGFRSTVPYWVLKCRKKNDIIVLCKCYDSLPLTHKGIDLFLIVRKDTFFQKKLRRAKAVNSVVCLNLWILFLWIKGINLESRRQSDPFNGWKLFFKCHCRSVCIRHCWYIPAEKCLFIIWKASSPGREKLCHLHFVVSDSPCLVYAYHVHSCKSLDGSHVMKKDFLNSQFCCTYGKWHSHKEVEALRDHTYDAADSRNDTLRKAVPVHHIRLIEKRYSYGND